VHEIFFVCFVRQKIRSDRVARQCEIDWARRFSFFGKSDEETDVHHRMSYFHNLKLYTYSRETHIALYEILYTHNTCRRPIYCAAGRCRRRRLLVSISSVPRKNDTRHGHRGVVFYQCRVCVHRSIHSNTRSKARVLMYGDEIDRFPRRDVRTMSCFLRVGTCVQRGGS